MDEQILSFDQIGPGETMNHWTILQRPSLFMLDTGKYKYWKASLNKTSVERKRIISTKNWELWLITHNKPALKQENILSQASQELNDRLWGQWF
jgi:hypothetical protein